MNRRNFFTTTVASLLSLAGIACHNTVKHQTIYATKQKRIPNVNYVEAGETPEWWLYEVYLNGEKVNACYMADTVNGYVEVWGVSLDKDGVRKYNAKVRKYGCVEIVRKQ